MAETAKIGPIFRGANGGISDDLFTGIQNSYYYSNLLEVREDAKSVYPLDKPEVIGTLYSTVLGNETAKPVAIIQSTSNYTNILVFVGKSVYSVDVENKTANLLCTFPNDICDAETFNGYIYITTTLGLYIIEEGASSSDWTTLQSSTTVTPTEPYLGRICDFAAYTTHHPLYASEICLCVGDKNELLKVMKETCNTTATGFTLQEGYTIKLITELGGFVRVIASDLMWGSEILLWDKLSNTIAETIPLPGYNFYQTEIYGGYQYLLSDKGLGVLNGYQYYILKKAQEGAVSSPAKNSMCVYNDKLYFCTSKGIYIYGAKNKNYNDVLSLWSRGDNYGCLFSDGLHLFTTRGRRTQEGIDNSIVGYNYYTQGVPSLKGESGELQTMAYFGTSLSEIKQSMYLRVGYKIPSVGNISGDIHIYYRTEADAVNNDADSWEWHPVQPNDEGLSAKWDMRSPFATTLKLNCRFQWIQFKFVIKNYVPISGTDYRYTHLYSADLYYNVMLD